jgi:hypothetical protein
LAAGAAIFLGGLSLIAAQGEAIDFGEGVSLLGLPFGWSAIDSAPPQVNPPGHAIPFPTLLLLAHPDSSTTVSASVIQDFTRTRPWGGMGSSAQSDANYLTSLVGNIGWRPGAPKALSARLGATALSQVSVEGTSSGTSRREFTLLSIVQPTQTLHLLFQRPPDDPKAEADLQSFLAQLVVHDQSVAAALATARPVDFSTFPASPFSRPQPATTEITHSSAASVVPAPTAADISAASRAAEAAQQHRNGLAIVEGEAGSGSGFVLQQEQAQWLVTNAHVMAANPGVKFTSLNGTALRPGAAGVAVGCDILRMALATKQSGAFELLPDVDSNVKIGDDIAVLGNSEGAGVVRALRGKVVGVGPQLVEVDAPFVPGNSGSPIIHLATGKVIGIATYMIVKKVEGDGTGKVTTNIRRFGYRLDGKVAWQPVNWAAFNAQAAQAEQIQELSNEFSKLFHNTYQHQPLDAGDYQNPALRRAISDFLDNVGHTHLSSADMNQAARRFMADLRLATQSDVAAFDQRNSYDYFIREVQEENRFRNELYKAFTESMDYYSH